MSEDATTTRSFDRRQFLKRAGTGAAVASVPLAAAPGAWAGLTRKSATKPLRIGNLLTLSGPNSAPPIDVKRGFVAYVLAHGHRHRRPQDPVHRRRRRERPGDRDPAGAEARERGPGRRDRGDLLLEHPARRPRHDRPAEGADGRRERRRERALARPQVELHLPHVVLELPARRPARPAGRDASSARAASPRSPRTTPPGRSRPPPSRTPTRRPAAASPRHDLHAVPDDAGLPAVPRSRPRTRARRRSGPSRPAAARRSSSSRPTSSSASTSSSALRQQQHDRPAERARLRGRRGGRHPHDGELGADAEEQGERALPQAVRQVRRRHRRRRSPSSATSRRSSSTSPCGRCTATRATSSACSTRWRTSARWQSPGGKLTMDPTTHNVIEPVYLRQVVKNGSNYGEKLISTLGIFKEPGRSGATVAPAVSGRPRRQPAAPARAAARRASGTPPGEIDDDELRAVEDDAIRDVVRDAGGRRAAVGHRRRVPPRLLAHGLHLPARRHLEGRGRHRCTSSSATSEGDDRVHAAVAARRRADPARAHDLRRRASRS